MKNNKTISALLCILIILSVANLFVGISNTVRINQLEDAPPVVIEKTVITTESPSAVIPAVTFKEKDSTETAEETTEKEPDSLTETQSDKAEERTTAKETTKAESSENGYCYVTSSGTKYHRSSCSYLKKSKTKMTVQEAKSCGYSPCSRCY